MLDVNIGDEIVVLNNSLLRGSFTTGHVVAVTATQFTVDHGGGSMVRYMKSTGSRVGSSMSSDGAQLVTPQTRLRMEQIDRRNKARTALIKGQEAINQTLTDQHKALVRAAGDSDDAANAIAALCDKLASLSQELVSLVKQGD